MAIKVEDSNNPILSSMLRHLRKRLYEENDINSYDVLLDLDLEILVDTQPTTPEEFMLALNKQDKLDEFGEDFMEVIRFYKSAPLPDRPFSFLHGKAVTMTNFLRPINAMLDKRGMCSLATETITAILMELGYLEEYKMDDSYSRVATSKGQWAGLESDFFDSGCKVRVLYNDDAQRLVLGILYDKRLLP